MMELFAPEAIAALFQVVMIDLALAGDDAIVVGMAAAGLPEQQRTRAILFGMAGGTGLFLMVSRISPPPPKSVGPIVAGGGPFVLRCRKVRGGLVRTAPRGRVKTRVAA